MIHHNYSLTSDRDRVIMELLEMGYSPLPVAPGHKNPSFVNEAGEIENVKHSRYRNRRPSKLELKKWFSNPDTGVGTNGGAWLDFDLKHFDSPEHLEATIQPIVQNADWVERTQGGGYRIAISPESKPEFTNFGIGDVDHAGELLNGGGFVVLAPTKGKNGDYVRLKFGEPLKIQSAEDLGLYATKKASIPAQAPEPRPLPEPPRLVEVKLEKLISKRNQKAVRGDSSDFKSRSDALVAIARDAYGWENLAQSEVVSVDSADLLIEVAAEALEIADKAARCLKEVNRGGCEPALAKTKGIEACKERLSMITGRSRPQTTKPATSKEPIYLTAADTPGLVAARYLYAEDYVRIGDDFYKWVGTHYEKQDERQERKRITKLFERCVRLQEGKDDEMVKTYPFCTKAKMEDAFGWCLASVPFISPERVNPAGLNLINGVLKLEFDNDGIPQPKLIEHSPKMVYTYRPQVAYHPEADDINALRLLQAIEPSYRPAVLRVFASAIDLQEVRRRRGRAVRGLILNGTGQNGKDSLRECLSYIFGNQGITSCTVSDFRDYDHGKQNTIYSLIESRVNWASENNVSVNIDSIQSLKQAITGDPLKCRKLYKDGQDFTPRCVVVLSCNDQPNLTATQEAIISRYVVVPFTKTFVPNPIKENEIKADPRFKDDPEWVKTEVCSALLNILIEQYQAIFREGIDYSPFAEAMEKNRLETNHLYRFAVDTGLQEDSEAWVPTGELWEKLRLWYEMEGILKVDANNRDQWEDDVRAGDAWVKGAQQLKRRLQKLFPNIETYRTNSAKGIKGIRFVDPVETALLECQTWGEYCRVVELHGRGAVDQTWHKLPTAVQNKICALQPDVTTPAPEPEPQPEPELGPEDITDAVEMLEQAVVDHTPEVLGLFESLPPEHKRRVWDATPLDIKAGVNQLRELQKVRE